MRFQLFLTNTNNFNKDCVRGRYGAPLIFSTLMVRESVSTVA